MCVRHSADGLAGAEVKCLRRAGRELTRPRAESGTVASSEIEVWRCRLMRAGGATQTSFATAACATEAPGCVSAVMSMVNTQRGSRSACGCG